MIRNYNLLHSCLSDAFSSVGIYERVSQAPAGEAVTDLRASFEEFYKDVRTFENDLKTYSVRELYQMDLDDDDPDKGDDIAEDFAVDFKMDERIAESRAAGKALLALLDDALEGMPVTDPAYIELNRERVAINAVLHAYDCCEAENSVKEISDTVHAEVDALYTELDTYDRLEKDGVDFLSFVTDFDEDEYTPGEAALYDRLDTLKRYSESAPARDMKTEYASLEKSLEQKKNLLEDDPDVLALTEKYRYLKTYNLTELSRMLDGKAPLTANRLQPEERNFVLSHKAGIQKLMDVRVLEQKKVLLAKSQPEAYRSMMKERAEAVASASEEGIRSQFDAMSKQLNSMRKFGFNTTDFRKFSNALIKAAKGGDMSELLEAAGNYINQKTGNGKNSPSSESGKARLELARQAARLARAAISQNLKTKEKIDALTGNLKKIETSSVDRIAEAEKEAEAADARLDKMLSGNGPLTAEEQAEAAELFLQSASNKLTQSSLSGPGTETMSTQLRHNPKMADRFIGNERAALNDAFFTSDEPLTRERLRELKAMNADELFHAVTRARAQKDYIANEQNEAIRCMTSPNSTPAELKDAAASLLACRAALNSLDVRRDEKAAIANAKEDLKNSPAFAALTADPAALRARFTAKDPSKAVSQLVQDLSNLQKQQQASGNSLSHNISNPSLDSLELY